LNFPKKSRLENIVGMLFSFQPGFLGWDSQIVEKNVPDGIFDLFTERLSDYESIYDSYIWQTS